MAVRSLLLLVAAQIGLLTCHAQCDGKRIAQCDGKRTGKWVINQVASISSIIIDYKRCSTILTIEDKDEERIFKNEIGLHFSKLELLFSSILNLYARNEQARLLDSNAFNTSLQLLVSYGVITNLHSFMLKSQIYIGLRKLVFTTTILVIIIVNYNLK